jgi:hypothetical protein
MEHTPRQCENPECEGQCANCPKWHYHCTVCDGYDGSVLPTCPGRRLSEHELSLVQRGAVTSVELLNALETLDYSGRDPKRNMYGCLPCPKCASVYRATFKPAGVLQIECDGCGHKAPARDVTGVEL